MILHIGRLSIKKANKSLSQQICEQKCTRCCIRYSWELKKLNQMPDRLFFGPNMNKEIEDMIKNYESCQQYSNRQISEPEIPHDIPDQFWHRPLQTTGKRLCHGSGLLLQIFLIQRSH